jgi:hypothetical protein
MHLSHKNMQLLTKSSSLWIVIGLSTSQVDPLMFCLALQRLQIELSQ